MKIRKHLLFTASMLGLFSCANDSTLPTNQLRLKIQSTAKTSTVMKTKSLVTSQTASLVWDTCYMNVSKVSFEAKKSSSEGAKDSSQVKFEWKGSKKVDLFGTNPLIGEVAMGTGLFEKMSLQLQSFKTDAGTAPVFYLRGNYTNSAGVTTTIIVNINEDFEFKVESKDAKMSASKNFAGLINLNLSSLMSKVVETELGQATLTNGKIVINISSNATLYDKIKGGLSSCEEANFLAE